MDKFSVKIESKLYERVNQKQANYIILLDNAKNQNLKNGNILTISDSVTGDNFDAKIDTMLYFESVKDIFSMVSKERFGYSASANVDYIEDYYVKLFKDEKITKYGVIAVKVEKL